MRVSGEVAVPGDKSISHRALILSAVARGQSRVTNILQSADISSTACVLRALGVAIPPLADDMLVQGVGRRGLRTPAAPLDCGNSGTTTRLMAGVVAGAAVTARFEGDASLSRRPMARVAVPLRAMGAVVQLPASGGLPMDVVGAPLKEIDYVSEAASAQIKSAVLLAAVMAHVPARVREPAPSRDHTERMLAARGVTVRLHDDGAEVMPVVELSALDIRVPGDPSSAAFLAALAALADAGELLLTGVCLNPTRAGFFHVLRRMGARVRIEAAQEGGELVGSIVVAPGTLTGTTIGASEVPAMIDELPLLACVAARADGVTEIRGAEELRVKESDRIAAVVDNLRGLGVDAEERPDGLRVRGGTKPLVGRVSTHGDHRLAMAFGVLGALPGNAVEIDDRDCVAVSYPAFWSDLDRVVS